MSDPSNKHPRWDVAPVLTLVALALAVALWILYH